MGQGKVVVPWTLDASSRTLSMETHVGTEVAGGRESFTMNAMPLDLTDRGCRVKHEAMLR